MQKNNKSQHKASSRGRPAPHCVPAEPGWGPPPGVALSLASALVLVHLAELELDVVQLELARGLALDVLAIGEALLRVQSSEIHDRSLLPVTKELLLRTPIDLVR